MLLLVDPKTRHSFDRTLYKPYPCTPVFLKVSPRADGRYKPNWRGTNGL